MVCNTCGNADHSRRSSAKCPHYIPPQKKRFIVNASAGTKDSVTIRMGLRKFCEDNALLERIREDVRTISSLAVEASLYVHHVYTRMLHNGPFKLESMNQTILAEYYNHLQYNKNPKFPRDEEFFKMRNTEVYYDCKNRNYLIQNIVVQHLTAMKNCVNVHLFNRVVRYFTFRHKDHETIKRWQWRRIVYEQLFDRENSADISNDEVRVFLNDYNLDGDFFRYDQERDWWSRIPFLHNLGVWFSSNGLRSFSLFPVFKPGLKHLQYNGMALYELLRTTGKLAHANAVLFRSRSAHYWWRYFNLSKKRVYGQFDYDTNEIRQHKGRTSFGFSFTTNGTYACVSLQKTRRNTTAADDGKTYSEHVGLDPGVVNFVGACYSKNGARDENFVLKSATFKQSHCGERKVKRRRAPMVGDYEKKLLEARKLLPDMTGKCAANVRDNRDYVQYRLDHHRDDQRVYGKTKLNKLQWWSKTLKTGATDSLVQHLLTLKGKTAERVLVCFGDGSLAEGQRYGRNCKPAYADLKRAFHRRKDRCYVVEVDEYMTTQCCSRCHDKMQLPPKHKNPKEGRRRHDHRFQFCRKCGITWNRDVNAARNMICVHKRLVDYRLKYDKNVQSPVEISVRPADSSHNFVTLS